MNNSITYKERAEFYNNEVSLKLDNLKLIENISKKYSLKEVILCPCASGVYFDLFTKTFEYSYFIDIEPQMIQIINNKITKSEKDNIKALICDMKNIDTLNINSDCIFILDQGMQYLSNTDFKMFLNKVYNTATYIILDLFDFNQKGKLSYYDSNVKDNVCYISKKFKYKDLLVTRFNTHFHNSDYIDFKYDYVLEGKTLFKTNFYLYNYEFDTISKIIASTNKYKIIETLNNKDGSYILVLKRREL